MSQEDPVTAEETKARIDEAVKFCESLIGVELPRTISEALTPEWMERAQQFGDTVVEHVSQDELDRGSRKVIPIATANAILRSIENRAVHLFVQAPTSTIVKAIAAPFAWMSYFIENEGKLLVLAAELASHLVRAIEGDFLEQSIHQWELRDKHLMNFDFGAFWRQLGEQNAINERLIEKVIESTSETIERFVTSMVWEQIGPIVIAMGSAAAFAKSVEPLVEARKYAEKETAKSPLPQISKGRVRRRKASRR